MGASNNKNKFKIVVALRLKMVGKELFAGFLLLLSAIDVEMHSYHLGVCPTVEPQSDFNMNRVSV